MKPGSTSNGGDDAQEPQWLPLSRLTLARAPSGRMLLINGERIPPGGFCEGLSGLSERTVAAMADSLHRTIEAADAHCRGEWPWPHRSDVHDTYCTPKDMADIRDWEFVGITPVGFPDWYEIFFRAEVKPLDGKPWRKPPAEACFRVQLNTLRALAWSIRNLDDTDRRLGNQ